MAKKKSAKKKSTKSSPASSDLSYGEAVAEIESILDGLERNESVDIDQLADQVEVASGHIQMCFSKLKAAETRVQKITAELEKATEQKNPKAKKARVAAEEEDDNPAMAEMADQFVEEDDDMDSPF